MIEEDILFILATLALVIVIAVTPKLYSIYHTPCSVKQVLEELKQAAVQLEVCDTHEKDVDDNEDCDSEKIEVTHALPMPIFACDQAEYDRLFTSSPLDTVDSIFAFSSPSIPTIQDISR